MRDVGLELPASSGHSALGDIDFVWSQDVIEKADSDGVLFS